MKNLRDDMPKWYRVRRVLRRTLMNPLWRSSQNRKMMEKMKTEQLKKNRITFFHHLDLYTCREMIWIDMETWRCGYVEIWRCGVGMWKYVRRLEFRRQLLTQLSYELPNHFTPIKMDDRVILCLQLNMTNRVNWSLDYVLPSPLLDSAHPAESPTDSTVRNTRCTCT